MGYVEYTPYRQRVTFEQDFNPIPKTSVDGWKKIPVIESTESHEKLIPIGPFSPYFSDCDMSAVYFGERGEGESINFVGHPVDRNVSLLTHYVREDVLNKLGIAQSVLPTGCYFRLYDTYRPLEMQQALFDAQYEKLRHEHPDWSKEKLEVQTQTYVSLPSPDPTHGTIHPSPHSTGGVVDLTIIRLSDEGQQLLHDLNFRELEGKLNYPISKAEKTDYDSVVSWIHTEATKKGWTKTYCDIVLKNWMPQYRYFKEKAEIFHVHSQELDMGTSFDHFGLEAGMRYFEELSHQRELDEKEGAILHNRRFLYRIMTEAGFANYPEEWWHWSYGDNMWAANKQKSYAIYSTVVMNEDDKTFEWARKGVYTDALSRIGKPVLFASFIEKDSRKV